MHPFLALITPLTGGSDGGGGGGQPPYPTTGPGFPTYPIVVPPGGAYPPTPGTPPLGIWGGGGVGNYPDAGFPGPQPGGPVYPDQGLPGQPPRPWGPINYPDQGLPGAPGGPSHPIFYPPVIWDPSRPSNPITNPGDPNDPGAGQPQIEWKTAWSPSTGWVVVGVPSGEHVTPSKEGGQQQQSKPASGSTEPKK